MHAQRKPLEELLADLLLAEHGTDPVSGDPYPVCQTHGNMFHRRHDCLYTAFTPAVHFLHDKAEKIDRSYAQKRNLTSDEMMTETGSAASSTTIRPIPIRW